MAKISTSIVNVCVCVILLKTDEDLIINFYFKYEWLFVLLFLVCIEVLYCILYLTILTTED